MGNCQKHAKTMNRKFTCWQCSSRNIGEW